MTTWAHAEAVCSSLPIRIFHLRDERVIGSREQPFGAEGAAMIHQVVYQMLRVLYSYAERKTFRFEPYTRRSEHAVGVVCRMTDGKDDGSPMGAGEGQGVGVLTLLAFGSGNDAVGFVMKGREFFSETNLAS